MVEEYSKKIIDLEKKIDSILKDIEKVKYQVFINDF